MCETMLASGKAEDALKLYNQIMQNAPPQFELWVNYASFLYRCGQYKEAANIAQKSVEIEPRAEGFHNLASALKMLGHFDEAIEAYKKAIHHNYNAAESHHDLAVTYEALKDFEKSIDHYQIATTLSPQKPLYWVNLARARKHLKRYRECLSALRFAILQDPIDDIFVLMHNLFEEYQDFDINSRLVGNVLGCFKSKTNDPMKLTKISQKLLLHQDVIKVLISNIEDNKLKNIDKLLADKSLNWAVFNHPLFIEMLHKLPIQDVNIETLLTDMRKHFLALTLEGKIKDSLWDQSHEFLAALACQCFLNEYVFSEEDSETEQLKQLGKKLEEAFASQSTPDPYALCLYGCYRPLHTLKGIERLLKNKTTSDLIRVQVKEPLEEQSSKADLKTYTQIDDEISKLVKAQYEENPYPRWMQPTALTAFSLKDLIQRLFPHMEEDEFTSINNDAPDVLIAGCGTGRQSIEASLSFENANILALDLSASSLAYAKRKTQEMGIENIEYGLGDILKFRELEREFDLIACTGVLHHMDDPMKGWQALYDILKPGGFMRIALYSEIARRPVIAARDFIAKQEFESTAEGIHMCRDIIRDLPDDHPIKPVMYWMDFYATSNCRDLIFHAQEHRYTCPELDEMIRKLGLDFMGFEIRNQDVLKLYHSYFPEDVYALDLQKWHLFEQKHPTAFVEMYQFWLQKPE